jgi:hypothetical protein
MCHVGSLISWYGKHALIVLCEITHDICVSASMWVTYLFKGMNQKWDLIYPMREEWHQLRVISWFLLLKSNSQDIDPQSLTHKLEHGLFEFHIRTPSSFLLLDHITFISSIWWSWCQNLKVYLHPYGIQPWIQHMDFIDYLWNVPSNKLKQIIRP